MITQCAFGQLKGRWRLLYRKCEAKSFTCANSTDKQSYFSFRLSRARMITQCAFGQLKGRWRLLYRKCEASQYIGMHSSAPYLY